MDCAIQCLTQNQISGLPTQSAAPILSPTTAAYAELQSAFDHYNHALFANALPHCLITMQRKKGVYGYFSSERFIHRHDMSMTDEIAINPAYFAVVPLLEILQTLVHEMVHAWQFHFGKPSRRGYHNTEWADKMISLGLMPSSTGKPGGKRTGEQMGDYPIDGGAFLQATDRLLRGDFAISWIDRFPSADLASLLGEGIRISLPTNRTNRIKYRCPSCGAQAWGKPALRLLCGDERCHAVRLAAAIG